MAKIFARAIPKKFQCISNMKVHWHDSAMHIKFRQDVEGKVSAGHAVKWRPGRAGCVPGVWFEYDHFMTPLKNGANLLAPFLGQSMIP